MSRARQAFRSAPRVGASHTNPVAHAFAEPYKMVRDRPARSGGKRTDFGRHFRLGVFVRGCGLVPAWWRAKVQAQRAGVAP